MKLTLLAALLAAAAASAAAPAAQSDRWSNVSAYGEVVRIYRDDSGAAHIFAGSNNAMFAALGWLNAQDRLWQLELSVRTGLGRLAEIMGSGSVNADILLRTNGYTAPELDAQLATLSAVEAGYWTAFVDGINRYIDEVIRPDVANKLPYEFQALGLGVPGPYSKRDILAVQINALRAFATSGGKEADNKAILDALTVRYGPTLGYAIFRDLRWTNDPATPGTIPDQAYGKRHPTVDARQLMPFDADFETFGSQMDAATDHWQSLGVPAKGGSIAFVVSGARSALGVPMLFGGPQIGFAVPEGWFEVQLRSDEGYDLTGVFVAGGMGTAIGRNSKVAWTVTTAGANDNTDTFVETKCTTSQGSAGYVFNGSCRAYEVRTEVFNIKGAAPRVVQILRSVHGPVASSTATVNLALQRSFWNEEMLSLRALMNFNTAHNLQEFKAAVPLLTISWNVLYADTAGNIAYWMAGCNPLRLDTLDPLLPTPGDGSAEWIGGCRETPESINPPQGWLANWNNAPLSDYQIGDQRAIGQIDRGAELIRDVGDMVQSKGQLTQEDMRQIVRTLASVVHPLARESPYLLPYLLGALSAVPPSHPLAAAARAELERWNGYLYADPVASTTFQAGSVIFSTWLTKTVQNTFNDDFGAVASQASANTLLHALDFALTGHASIPPAIDYFNGVDPNRVMSNSFDQIVATLAAAKGSNPANWTNPRANIVFSHPLIGVVGTALNGDRASFAQLVTLHHGGATGESMMSLGQSGFIKANVDGSFTLDPHFSDQLGNFRNMVYKQMPLYLNQNLKVKE